MTEIWISSKKSGTRCAGTVHRDRARHVAQEWNRKGFKVTLRQVGE